MKLSSTPRLASVTAVALSAPLLLAGCGPLGSGGSDGGPRVVASFYPLEYVAERVAGDHADVVGLTSPGVPPHDLELTVRQTAEVSDADLVVYEKDMQPAVDEAVAEHGPDQVVEVSEVVELAPLSPGEHEGESEEADHAESDADLHFWLDPERMSTLATEVERHLSEVDPGNAADYKGNLEALEEDLSGLDADYQEGLSTCEVDTVVVSHDAFGYLEKYGLHFEPIAGLSPDAEPSAARLTELADLVDQAKVTVVFSETLASPALAKTLARDVGVETGVLDPIEGLSDTTADEDYLSLMRTNLDELRTANRCR
jgi:zinc transport system substrate-binding protein